jgi:hypothetical protein
VSLNFVDDPGNRGEIRALQGVLPCGPDCDVLWNGSSVYLMKERGRAKYLFSDGIGFAIGSAVFDGRYVWLTTDARKDVPRVRVLDPRTEQVWDLTIDHGLPLHPPEGRPGSYVHAIRAAAVAEGQAILVGGFGRTWMARVNFDPAGKHEVTVFSESRLVSEQRLSSYDYRPSDYAAFTPQYAYSLVGNDGSGKPMDRILLGMLEHNASMLLDPGQLNTTYVASRWPLHDGFDIHEGRIYYVGSPRNNFTKIHLLRSDASSRDAEVVLTDVPPGMVVIQGEMLNIVGRHWWRGRLADGQLENLGQVPWRYRASQGAVPPEQRETKGWADANLHLLRRSSHYGILINALGGRWPGGQALSEMVFDGPDRTVLLRPPSSPSVAPRPDVPPDVQIERYLAVADRIGLSADRRLLAIARGSHAMVIDTNDLRVVQRVEITGLVPPPVALSPDGQKLVVATESRGIQVWDVKSGREIRRFPSGGRCRKLAFFPDSKQFATTSHGSVRVCNIETGVWMALEYFDSFIDLLPDGSLVGATSTLPNKLIAWNPETLEYRLLWERIWGTPLAMSLDGEWVLTKEYVEPERVGFQNPYRTRVRSTATGEARPLTERDISVIGTIPINDRLLLVKAVSHDDYNDATKWHLIKKDGWSFQRQQIIGQPGN